MRLRTDVHKQYSGDIHVNVVSSYSRAASSTPHKQLSSKLFVTLTLEPQENDK